MASSGTVMIVDDERFFLTILGDFVAERLQMKPLLVQDGATAVALLEAEQPELVLLDVVMPGMDGLEVLRRLKARQPALPVIMVTSTSDIEHAIAALRAGADEFVRKPVDPDRLAVCVASLLQTARPAQPPTPDAPLPERRRAPRVRLRTLSAAQLQQMAVALIDLSPVGVLVEHADPVRLGEVYRVSVPLAGEPLPLLARAVRAYVSHRVTVAGGARAAVYRTGMEFVGLDRASSDRLRDHIATLVRQGAAARSN